MRTNNDIQLLFFLTLCMIFSSCTETKNDSYIATNFSLAEQHYTNMMNVATDLTQYPRTSELDGSLRTVDIHNWTGGFWPGNLWYVYEFTKNDKWKKEAVRWTESLESNKYNTSHHDIGFMMYCSYGNAYRLTQKEEYRDVLIQSARSLCERYSPAVGSIMSWNPRKSIGGKNSWDFPVIIDNMINLELLFFAFEHTRDSVFRDIAIRHAERTMANHVRSDFSTFHVIDYDPQTGEVLHRQTAQGLADSSTWARGQAWGIYGFTMMYRFTGDDKFLTTATGLADFFLNNKNLPDDFVPYWDFNAADKITNLDWEYDSSRFSEIPRDASAAAITASALLELSTFVKEKGKQKKYFDAAVRMLHNLSNAPYIAMPGENNNFLLKHSVGNLPGNNEVNVPLVYADYYFLEALLRHRRLLSGISLTERLTVE